MFLKISSKELRFRGDLKDKKGFPSQLGLGECDLLHYTQYNSSSPISSVLLMFLLLAKLVIPRSCIRGFITLIPLLLISAFWCSPARRSCPLGCQPLRKVQSSLHCCTLLQLLHQNLRREEVLGLVVTGIAWIIFVFSQVG